MFYFFFSLLLLYKTTSKLHHTCNKILLIYYAHITLHLHLQKGKNISSEVWTKSDNHRDCIVLRPRRSITLVVVRVCLVSWECVYIYIRENSLVVQVNGFTVIEVVLPYYHSHLLLMRKKDEWKHEQVWKMAIKAEQIWMIQSTRTFVCACV